MESGQYLQRSVRICYFEVTVVEMNRGNHGISRMNNRADSRCKEWKWSALREIPAPGMLNSLNLLIEQRTTVPRPHLFNCIRRQVSMNHGNVYPRLFKDLTFLKNAGYAASSFLSSPTINNELGFVTFLGFQSSAEVSLHEEQ